MSVVAQVALLLFCAVVGGQAHLFGSVTGFFSGGKSLRATEVDEDGFYRWLEQIRGGDGSTKYLVVLFYAEWCPFSRDMRRIVDDLQPLYPSSHGVQVLAVEERNSTSMMLSRVGIHSFPTTYVHMKGARRKFSGERSLHRLASFVANVTSVRPARKVPPGECAAAIQDPPSSGWGGGWFAVGRAEGDHGGGRAKDAPEKEGDVWLALATAFLVLRAGWLVAAWLARTQRMSLWLAGLRRKARGWAKDTRSALQQQPIGGRGFGSG